MALFSKLHCNLADVSVFLRLVGSGNTEAGGMRIVVTSHSGVWNVLGSRVHGARDLRCAPTSAAFTCIIHDHDTGVNSDQQRWGPSFSSLLD
jgi:hypothetical protein